MSQPLTLSEHYSPDTSQSLQVLVSLWATPLPRSQTVPNLVGSSSEATEQKMGHKCQHQEPCSRVFEFSQLLGVMGLGVEFRAVQFGGIE